MNHLSRILISTTFAAAATAACAAPKLHWINPVYDFGAFREELGPVTGTFMAINTGDEPAVVLSARANCGCTKPRYPKEPVAPGDTLKVSVTYDPSGRPGRFLKNVKVVSNATNSPADLKVKGTVIASSGTLKSRYPVEAGRARLSNEVASMGECRKGRVLAGAVNIYNPTSDTIVPRTEGMPRYINGLFRPKAIPPGELGILSLTAYTDRCDQWGLVTDSFRLIPDSNYPELGADISTVLIINEDFSRLTPQQLEQAPAASLSDDHTDFGEMSDAPASRTLTLTNTGRSTLIVRRIYTPDQAIDVKADSHKIKPGGKTEITVTANPAKASEGSINGRITLITNDPANPTQIIKVTGLTQ